MKKLSTILLLMSFLLAGCGTNGSFFGSILADNPQYIEVMRGDTLYSLSRKYSVSTDELARHNNLRPPYSLMIGQTLYLPGSSNERIHKVVKGDTLYNISKRYDVPLRDVIETNELKPPYNLTLGQGVVIPNNRYHIVSKGDTLYNISKRYDVDVTTLSKVNDIQPPFSLSIGDKLVLPATISSAPQTPTRTVAARTTSKTSVAKTKAKTTAKKQPVKSKAKKTTVKKAPRTTQARARTISTKRTAKFAWPVRGKIISNFGTIGKGRKNDGINIQAPQGTIVKAADKGTVVYAGNELKGFGNLILIKHPDGYITAYAHNERIYVRKGQSVRKGDKVSAVGRTGGVNIPQLHFEVHVNKKPVNPINYLE